MNKLPVAALADYTNITYEAGLEAAKTALLEYGDYGSGEMTIAALGPAGSNSHVVALDIKRLTQQDIDPVIDLRPNFSDILNESTRHGRVGILPIANRIGGAVMYQADPPQSNIDTITAASGRILSIVGLPIGHCLLGRSKVELPDLAGMTIHSHRQALLQCSGYIATHGLVEANALSTSAAAADLSLGEIGERSVVIAPKLAAEIYGLEILAEDIGDLPSSENVTTMAIVSVDL